jgi:hypothetical protein
MLTRKSAQRAAIAAMAATAMLLGLTANGASAAPPKADLTGEGPWQSDGRLFVADSTAEANDAATNTEVRMWRDRRGVVSFQVTQGGTFYPVQLANASSANAPYVIIRDNFLFAFHRGNDQRAYYATMPLITPTAGSNFRLSSWAPVAGVSTLNTPVVTERNGDFWMAYSSLFTTSILTIHVNANDLRDHRPNWVDNRTISATSHFAPAITNFGGQLNLVYIDSRTGQLHRITSNGDNVWSSPRNISGGLPALWGRPSIMASGDMLDVVVLGNDPDNQGGRTIYRRSLTGNQGWVTDPRGFRTPSPVMLWATANAAAFIIGIALRGARDGMVWTKTLSSTVRR